MSDKDKKIEEDKVLYKGEEMSPKEFAERFEDENKKKERNAESVARQKLEKKQEEESRRKSFVNALIPKEEDKVEDDYGPGSEQEESQPDMSMYRVNLPFDVQEGPNLKLGPIGQQQIPEPEVEYRLGGLMSLMDDNNIQSYKDGGKRTSKSKDGTVTNKFKDKNGNIVTQVKTKDGKYFEKKYNAQDAFNEDFKVTEKSKYDKVSDKIEQDKQAYLEQLKKSKISIPKEDVKQDLDELENSGWKNYGKVGEQRPEATVKSFTPDKPQGFVDKAVDIISNPMTSAGFLARGQGIPDYMQRDMDNGTFGYFANGSYHNERNPLDLAIGDMTGLSLLNDVRNVKKGVENGDVNQAGWGLFAAIPVLGDLKGAIKGTKNIAKNSDEVMAAGSTLSDYRNIEELRHAYQGSGYKEGSDIFSSKEHYDKAAKESKDLYKKYNKEFEKKYGPGRKEEVLIYGAHKELKNHPERNFLANEDFSNSIGANSNLTNQEKFLSDAYQLEFSELFNKTTGSGFNPKFAEEMSQEMGNIVSKNKINRPVQVKRASNFNRDVRTKRDGSDDFSMIHYNDLKEGDVIYPDHLWSTTSDVGNPVWGSDTNPVARINLPSEQKVLRPNTYTNSQYPNEQEIILPKETGYKVSTVNQGSKGDDIPRFIFDAGYRKGGYILGGLMDLINDDNISAYKESFKKGGVKTVKSKDGTVTNKFKDKNGNIVTQVKTKDGKYYEKTKSRDQIIADRKKSIETLNQIGLAVKNPIIDMIEPSLDLEEKVEYNLGHPMKKAANIARYKAGEGNDPIDNFRHPMAGRYTAEAAYKLRKENTPWAPEWLNKTGAWIDANTLGVAHEATTLFKDERPWGVKLREAAEDIYNNGVGVNTGLSNSTAREKTNYLLDLSYNNKLPDGYGDQKRPMYFKKKVEINDNNIQSHKDGGKQKGGGTNSKAQDDWFESLKSTLNPYNWGVEDYSKYKTKGQAFNAARKAGEKEFMWNNQRYNTDYAGTLQQQLKETGITNEQLFKQNKIQERLYNNLIPVSYNNMGRRVIDAVIKNKKDPKKEPKENEYSSVGQERQDAFNLYMGKPQTANTFSISKSKPGVSKNKNDMYYSLNDEQLLNDMVDMVDEKGNMLDYSKIRSSKEEPYGNPELSKKIGSHNVMGNFTVSKGEDERGRYLSYYDKWDIAPMDFGKPFEIYDRIYIKDYGDGKQKRMYYTDKELSTLDPNKKDFDTQGLQKELSNRGYKFPKSTTKEGAFDGIYGEETKNALLEYQSKNKHQMGGNIIEVEPSNKLEFELGDQKRPMYFKKTR